MRKYKAEITKALIILALLFSIATVCSVYWVINCDFEDAATLIETPDGRHIKKFDPDQPVKQFSVLSKKCDYEKDRVYCPDIRSLGETMLRQVQLATIRMLIAFDKVCRKHGIKYWLWRGALLGAFRHKAFIPWDNELDIGIMKEDYEKFRMFSHELPADIFLQNASSDPAYKKARHPIIAKLRDTKGCIGYCLRTGCGFHNGLMIDIFGFQENGEDSIIETTMNKVKFVVHKSDIFPLKEMKFEGYNVYVPNKRDVILKNNYGADYHKIPSQNRRCPPGTIIGIPWFSCNDLKRMSTLSRNYYLYLSMMSKLKYFAWYFQ